MKTCSSQIRSASACRVTLALVSGLALALCASAVTLYAAPLPKRRYHQAPKYLGQGEGESAMRLPQALLVSYPDRRLHSPALVKSSRVAKEKRLEWLVQALGPDAQSLIASYYPEFKAGADLAEVLAAEEIVSYAEVIDERPNYVGAAVALNAIVRNFGESDRDVLGAIAYLVVWRKHPASRVGSYAREKLVEVCQKTLDECLGQEAKELKGRIDRHPNQAVAIDALGKLGAALMEGDKEAMAIHLYCTVKHPGTAVARADRSNLGDIYYDAKDYDAALAEYKQAIGDNPESPRSASLQNRIASCLYELKRLDEALAACEKVANSPVESHLVPAALEMIARIQHERGNPEAAYAVCKRIKESYPRPEISVRDLSAFLAARELRVAAEIANLRATIDTSPDSKKGVLAMGELLQAVEGEEEKTRLICEDILAEHRGTKTGNEAQLRLARVSVERRQYDDAIG